MDTSSRRAARRWTINVLFVYAAGRCRSPILNRAERIGPSGRHQRLADWIKAAGAEREPYDALGTNPGDEVPDPYGQRPRVWNRVINDLDDNGERDRRHPAAR